MDWPVVAVYSVILVSLLFFWYVVLNFVGVI
jgi:hypothetical protein